MKQLVIRILWPQLAVSDVSCWTCVRESIGLSEEESTLLAPAESVTLETALQEFSALHTATVDCSVLLPAEIALFDRIQLPARNKRQALQALPFVVEEQLADDIEGVHLSVGNRQVSGAWPVIAFDREQMQQLFSLLTRYSMTPHTVSVDAERLPAATGELCIVMNGDRVLLRSESIATAVELENASLYLQMLEGVEKYRKIQVFIEPEHEQHRLLAEQWSTEFSALDDVVTTITPVSDSMSALLFADLQWESINLLQGDFHLRKPSKGIPWWQVVAASLVFALAGQVTLQLASGWYFNRQANALVVMGEQQYREWFPDAKKVSDPRKRLESKLAGDGSTQPKDAFTYIFSKTVDALKSVSDGGVMSIEQLRFEGKRSELELELKASSIEQLDKFKQVLTKAGLQADISSANESDAGILGRVKIKAGG